MECSVCAKELNEGEGFIATVNKDGKAPSESDIPVLACSEKCRTEFEKTLSRNGKPLYHLSRITGYVQILDNWNDGKKAEFNDRKRHSI